ncbi:unnamed protein product, partial [Staurois parvus]
MTGKLYPCQIGTRSVQKKQRNSSGILSVMSSQRFSSGRHYWEVDVGGSKCWIVGMCYPSIDRRGGGSRIGKNNKSWGLDRTGDQYSVRHDSIETSLPANPSSNRVRIYLDYE